MEYTVLARRFRPQAFDQVVGQQHVAQALRNAISGDRVAHAYLFTGARGVGKTSMARILAKSLNCPQAVDGNPCNQCEICQAISTGSDVDVLEIDGASNRGVDEVRTLRANVGVRSLRSRYKIYIIDEVHMLTKEAFNALLKTLEEPPPSVKFIFCTTDPQKLPDTILSRCQRFDFGTIATASIAERLREIARVEGVEVEPAAIELVARRAAGSMRDSQSLFDQLLAFGGKQIGVEVVHRLLGTAPDDRLIDLGAALCERRRADALKLLDACLAEGVQLTELTDQIVSYLRDLMVLAAGAKESALQSVADECRPRLESQARAWGLNAILVALQILADAKQKMKGVTYGRALVELALVRISLLEDLEKLSEVVQLLKSGKSGGPVPTSRTEAQVTRVMAPVERRVIPADLKAEIESLKEVPSPRPAGANGQTEQKNTTEEPRIRIPFEAGREMDILSQLHTRSTDPQIQQIKVAAHAAILGPNQLAISFGRRYDWLAKSLERPEVLGRLERLLEEITGTRVGVKFRVDPAGPAEPVEAAPQRTPASTREVERDPLVQKVMTLFGAQIVRVDAAPLEAAAEVPATQEPE